MENWIQTTWIWSERDITMTSVETMFSEIFSENNSTYKRENISAYEFCFEKAGIPISEGKAGSVTKDAREA